MKRGLVFATLLLLMTTSVGRENDVYQLLRRGGADYQQVLPGRILEFPRDHLSHPGYRIEWWYLTANLIDTHGHAWGLHWTLFRQALNADGNPQGWNSNQVWMAHAALSTPNGHRYQQRFARGGIDQAGVAIDDGRFQAWLDDWQLTGDGPEPLPGTLVVRMREISARLDLSMDTPWVLHGDRGYSQKSAQGQASYYYSQPHVQVTGVIDLAGKKVSVRGQGWFDREWSSQPLAENQPGWDWFSLHFRDGSALMVFRLRQEIADDDSDVAIGHSGDWVSGTWINPNGDSRALSADDIRLRPLKERMVQREQQEPLALPLVWSLALPGMGGDYQWIIRAPDPQHWLATSFPYWEGPVVAEGANPGVGYLELTGYR
mgnify:CR=1 FL=1